MSQKLPTPGGAVREKSFGQSAGAGAVAVQGRSALAHVATRTDDDLALAGGAAGDGRRGSNAGSRMHEGRLSSVPAYILPPPLASRSGGAGVPRQDAMPPLAPTSALGSSWIRRVLPSTAAGSGGDVGQDSGLSVPPEPARAMGAGVHSTNALTFAPTTPSPNLGSPEAQTSRELAARIVANGHGLLKEQKSSQDLNQDQRMTADSASSLRNPDKPDAIERARKHVQHQVMSGGAEVVLREPQHDGSNDERERRMTGFGSLRVLVKPQANDGRTSGAPAQGSRPPLFPEKSSGLEAEDGRAGAHSANPADRSPRNEFRIPTVSSKLARPPLPGKQVSASGPPSSAAKDPKYAHEADRARRPVAAEGRTSSRAAQRDGLGVEEGKLGKDRQARAAGKIASLQVALSESESCAGGEAAQGSGVESATAKLIERSGSNIVPLETPVPSQHHVSLSRGENFVNSTKSHQVGRGDGELAEWPSLPGESRAADNRTSEEVRSGGYDKRRMDAGPSPALSAPNAYPPRQRQGDSRADNFADRSPRASPAALATELEGAELAGVFPNWNGDQMQPLLTPLFGTPKIYGDGSDGLVRQGEKEASLWTPVLSSLDGQKHYELYRQIPPGAMGLFPSFPTRFYNAPFSNESALGPKESDNHRKDGADWHVRSGISATENLVGPFNLSSHQFLRGWLPGDEGQDPNEDVASCPNDSSQRTAFARQSWGRSVPRGVRDLEETHSYGRGVDNPGRQWTERHRESSANEDGGGRFTQSQGEVGRTSQMPNDRNQGHIANLWRHAQASSASGERNEHTSGSSPPSYPPGHDYSSDMGSPVRGAHRGGFQGRRGPVDAGMDVHGAQPSTRHTDFTENSEERRARRGKAPRDTETQARGEGGGDSGKCRDFIGTDVEVNKFLPARRSGPGDVSTRRPPSSDGDRAGEKHGRSPALRAAADDPHAGPAKRSCQDLESSEPTSRQQDEGKPSVWLQRWLKPSGGGHSGSGKSATDDAFLHMQRGFGDANFMQRFGGKQDTASPAGAAGTDAGARLQARFGHGRGVSGVQAFVSSPTPSAAALALASAAAGKPGPVPQQRRGSLNFWAPVRLPPHDASRNQKPP